MAIGMNPRKKGLFGRNIPFPATPGVGDGDPRLPQNDPAPGLGMRSAAPEPEKSGFLGQGGVGRAVIGNVADAISQYYGGMPVYAQGMAERQREEQARQQAAAKMRERSMDMADWRWKEDYKRENAGPSAPNLREDNAGNVWQFDPQTGMPMGDKPVWVDPTEKIIYQDGMQIRVPNPYRSGGGSSTPSIAPGTVDGGYRFKGGDPADQSNWEPVIGGGPTQPASGGFRR